MNLRIGSGSAYCGMLLICRAIGAFTGRKQRGHKKGEQYNYNDFFHHKEFRDYTRFKNRKN
jgi:hypothetical protein